MKRIPLAGLLVLTAVAAQAAPDSTETALNLGSVLAAEEPCGLHFDQQAIAAYVSKNVKADDMGFPSALTVMTEGAKAQLGQMTESQRTAQCTQIKRLAVKFGFIGK